MAKQNSYSKAVDQFIRLSKSVSTTTTAKPRQLALNSQIVPSSGYRFLKALEQANFIQRDAMGLFIIGQEARRISMNAWGIGRYAEICVPILHTLRQTSQRTAFIGLVNSNKLWIGPFSLGRGAKFAIPSPYVVFGLLSTLPEEQPLRVHLSDISENSRSSPTTQAVLLRLCPANDDATAVLGLLLLEKDDIDFDILERYLINARHRLLHKESLHAG